MARLLTAGILIGLAGAAAQSFDAHALAQDRDDPRKAEVVGRLNNSRITLDFKEARLDDVVAFLREFTGINFHIDGDVRTKLSEDQLRITFQARDLQLKSALRLMLSTRELTAVYRDGVIVLQHRDKTSSIVALEMYDVRDLLLKIQDFPGPKLELEHGKSGIVPIFDIEDEKSPIDEDFLVELVKTGTGDRSWEENPKAGVTLTNGVLVVTQSRKVHEEIRKLLNLLRQYK